MKTLLIVAVALGLSGCATAQTHLQEAAVLICNHAAGTRVALDLAMLKALDIPNDQERAAAVAAIQASKAALDRCPPRA